MATVNRDALIDAVEAAGLDADDAICDDYSGRGMYGDTCVGLVVDDVTVVGRVALELERAGESDAAEALTGGGSTDSLGLNTIVYWRSLSIED